MSAAGIDAAFDASDRLRSVRSALGAGEEVWVVGGAVRDALLGVEIGDIDLATSADPQRVARELAKGFGGPRFELSSEHATWRVSHPADGGSIDVAALRGPSIEADLRLRDFAINAVAVPIGGGPPIDPAGGIEDARSRRLRVTSERSFDDDPLRLMRAARLAAAYGLELSEQTVALARRTAHRANEPAGERRFAELRGMVAGVDPLRALELLDELALTPVVLPQLAELRGVEQSANHHLDVHAHTLEVLQRWLAVETELDRYAGDAAPEVAAALARPLADGLSRRDGIRFAAILHDIGKPATRTEREGFVGFRGHDRVGAEMIAELCRELRTSRRFSDYLAAITRHHLVLGFMTHQRPLPRRRIWEYLELTAPVSLDVTLLTVADRLSAQGAGVPSEAISAHLELAREMIAEIVALERDGPPAPLLGGAEIAAELSLEGERIGAAVAELAAAQFAGEVSTREQALEHLRAWIAEAAS